jgi:hypothetical protein
VIEGWPNDAEAVIVLAHELGHVITMRGIDTVAYSLYESDLPYYGKQVYNIEKMAWDAGEWLLSHTDFDDLFTFDEVRGICLKSYGDFIFGWRYKVQYVLKKLGKWL